MLLKGSVFAILIALLALVGFGSGAENDIGQGLFVDGPGGYLPGGDSVNGNADHAQMPSIDYKSFIDHLVNYNDLLSVLSYWENYWGNYL